MDNFFLYAEQNGVQWYRCIYCKALSRGKPDICPVCHSVPKSDNTDINEDKQFEEMCDKFKKILDKYQKI